jgi:hypothetical protein
MQHLPLALKVQRLAGWAALVLVLVGRHLFDVDSAQPVLGHLSLCLALPPWLQLLVLVALVPSLLPLANPHPLVMHLPMEVEVASAGQQRTMETQG